MGKSGMRGRWKKNGEENARTIRALGQTMTTPTPKMGGVVRDIGTLAKRDWDQPSR
jgi:hypothetical protein